MVKSKKALSLHVALDNLAKATEGVAKALAVFGVSMAQAHDVILSGNTRTHLKAKMNKANPPKLYLCDGVPFVEPVHGMMTHAGRPGAVISVGNNFVVLDTTGNPGVLTSDIPPPLEDGLAQMLVELETKVNHESK